MSFLGSISLLEVQWEIVLTEQGVLSSRSLEAVVRRCYLRSFLEVS